MTIRALHGHAEMRALSDLFDRIWEPGDAGSIPKEVFVGAEHAGHQIHGAFIGDELSGGSWGFLCYDGARTTLHSHITGVLPSYQGTGMGLALKHAQRDWCLQRGITLITWTFDPFVARNAAFNLNKLGATGVAYLPDFYGPMNDRFNAGKPTDRIEIHWDPTAAPREASDPTWVPVDDDMAHRMQALFANGFTATGFDRTRGYAFTPGRRPDSLRSG